MCRDWTRDRSGRARLVLGGSGGLGVGYRLGEAVTLTRPGLVEGVRAAIEGEDLEGYEIALGEAMAAELAGTSPRAFLRFLASPAGRLASLR